jgi:hypothetical protein
MSDFFCFELLMFINVYNLNDASERIKVFLHNLTYYLAHKPE